MTHCPVCDHTDLISFFDAAQQPVLIGQKCASEAEAKNTPRGDISLRCCKHCSFVWNADFDIEALAYSAEYENSLHYSPTFQTYTQGVVDHLVSTYKLNGKQILDFGCGKGDFLTHLCDAAGASGTGIDPSYEGPRASTERPDNYTWITSLFDPSSHQTPYDLIVSRFVLEHIPEPAGFVASLREYVNRTGSGSLYIEVPNVDLIVNQGSLWDVIYEHCSYFGPHSLKYLFERNGFRVARVTEGYDKQFVAVEACETPDAHQASTPDVDEVLKQVEGFAAGYRDFVASWQHRLTDWDQAGKRVVLWGAGAKTVSFLNLVDAASAVDYVVDINPHKIDHYIPGSAHAILSTDTLEERNADVVVLMNPIYEGEIRADLAARNLAPQIELLY